MRQHRNATTTEDIAAVGERPAPGPIDAGPIDADPVDSDRTDADSLESERVESGPVTADETARPADTMAAGQAAPRETADSAADVLFDEAEAERFRARWREVQTAFVDDPKRAVEEADILVAELMQELASALGERKRVLEGQWREGADAETEDLRLTLRGYRSFVDRLLAH